MNKKIEIIKKYHPQCNLLNDDEIIENYSAFGIPQMMQEYAEWLAEQAYKAGYVDGINKSAKAFLKNQNTNPSFVEQPDFETWLEKIKKEQYGQGN